MKAATARLEQKSPAEFFAENKNIAGFDNVRFLRMHPTCCTFSLSDVLSIGLERVLLMCAQPGKCLYTTVRELVENSLDAAESIGLLPDIDIEM